MFQIRFYHPIVSIVVSLCLIGLLSAARAQHSSLSGLQTIPMSPSEAQLPKVNGAISWELLGKVTTQAKGKKLVAHFPSEILKLHQTQITLVGYLMPLEPGKTQRKFLLSYSPQTCNFCLPAGPEGVVEVLSKQGVKVSYEPIVVKGTLEVLPDDPDGMYYRLKNAQAI